MSSGEDVFQRLNSPSRESRRGARLRSPEARLRSPPRERLGSPQRQGRARRVGSPQRAPRTAEKRVPRREERERLFRRLDADGHGFLSLAQIEEAASELLPHVKNRPALVAAYTAADVKSDGWIGRREFRQVLAHLVFFNDRWPLFESVAAGQNRRLSPAQFCAACAHVGCPTDPADAAVVFAELDKEGSGSVSKEAFCTWVATNPERHVPMATKASSPPPESASAGQGTPSLQEIDELESVYADFVSAAPIASSVTPSRPSPKASRAAQNLADISSISPSAGGDVSAWGSGADGEEEIDSLLRLGARPTERKGARRAASPRAARVRSPSRLVRSMVSPPRRSRRVMSPLRQSYLSEKSTFSSRTAALLSPPRAARSSKPAWSGNCRPFHRVESAARSLWEAKREQTARSRNIVTKAVESHLREWHPAYTGRGTVHETLHALHLKSQQRKEEARQEILAARELQEAAACQSWDAARRARSSGRPRVGGLDVASRSMQWQRQRDSALEEKREVLAAVKPRGRVQVKEQSELEEHSQRLHDAAESRNKEREALQKKHEVALLKPLFKPQVNPKSKRIAGDDPRGHAGLIEWGEKQHAARTKRMEEARKSQTEGLFHPQTDGKALMSPERERRLGSPAKVSRRRQKELATKLGTPSPRALEEQGKTVAQADRDRASKSPTRERKVERAINQPVTPSTPRSRAARMSPLTTEETILQRRSTFASTPPTAEIVRMRRKTKPAAAVAAVAVAALSASSPRARKKAKARPRSKAGGSALPVAAARTSIQEGVTPTRASAGGVGPWSSPGDGAPAPEPIGLDDSVFHDLDDHLAAAGTAGSNDLAAAYAMETEQRDVAEWIRSLDLGSDDPEQLVRCMHEQLIETVGDLGFLAHNESSLSAMGVPNPSQLWAALRSVLPLDGEEGDDCGGGLRAQPMEFGVTGADPVAVLASTEPQEKAIDAAARAASTDVHDLGTETSAGLHQLSVSDLHMFDLCPASTSIREPGRTTFTVHVTRARNLAKMDRGGKADPYVVLRCGDVVHQTGVVKKSLAPEWKDARFQFNVPSVEVLQVEMYDWDRGSKDEPMGCVSIPLRNMGSAEQWFKLEPMPGCEQPQGELQMTCTVLDTSVEEGEAQWTELRETSRIGVSSQRYNLPLPP